MAVLGLTEDDFEGDVVEIWPENLRVYEVFNALSGAWRFRGGGIGPDIPLGIERAEILATFKLTNVPRDDWPELFEDIRAMESAALCAMSEPK